MNRHSFRWEALAFGLLFLAVVGTWSACKSGLLESDQLAYAPAATLIVLGVAGIIASFATPRRTVGMTTETTPEADTETSEGEVPNDVEETDPQS